MVMCGHVTDVKLCDDHVQRIASWLGSLQSLDWNGGMEWWNGIVECLL